jgi:hypothetical protein
MAKRRKRLMLKEKRKLKRKGICWKCLGPINPKSKDHICEGCSYAD